MLLGTFTSTSTPGEFVWKAGPLTKAVESGMWLLMEDIELATPDVVSTKFNWPKLKTLVGFTITLDR